MKSFLVALLGCLLIVGTVRAETFVVDPAHSSVGFKIRHLGVSWVNGSFEKVEGVANFDPAKPEASTVSVTVYADSIKTGNEKRDGHLKTPDFFNTAKYPTLTFKSNKVVKKEGDTYEVTGDLTLLAVTKSITFTAATSGPANGMKPGEVRRGGDTEFTIKRSDYGMTKDVGLIGDDVKISLSFETVKQ